MLVVTVELISAVDGHREVLGTAKIANDVRMTHLSGGSLGDYTFEIRGKKKLIRTGRVENFPRKRLLAWDLLHRVLKTAFSNRNP